MSVQDGNGLNITTLKEVLEEKVKWKGKLVTQWEVRMADIPEL